LRRGGERILDALLAHLAPVGWQQINLTGDYPWDADGSAYDDDLFEDGVIYHFPVTKRPGRRDASETAAIRNLFELRLPVFVITPTPSNGILSWTPKMRQVAKVEPCP
jgi:hypothetical protein